MGENGQSMDWARVVIHFVIGAIAGAGLAFLICVFNYEGMPWTPMLVAGLVLGTLAAVFGDRFWEGFGSLMKWLSWWV